jgi:hypothetical protein
VRLRRKRTADAAGICKLTIPGILSVTDKEDAFLWNEEVR